MFDAYIDEFVAGYLHAAIFTTNDESDESGGVPLDEAGLSEANLTDAARHQMTMDCHEFIRQNQATLWAANHPNEYPADFAGIDFWLSRNGHGSGYFDRDLGKRGDKLDQAAKEVGTCDLLVGEDGQIHIL